MYDLKMLVTPKAMATRQRAGLRRERKARQKFMRYGQIK
jgi:hypothetical protein